MNSAPPSARLVTAAVARAATRLRSYRSRSASALSLSTGHFDLAKGMKNAHRQYSYDCGALKTSTARSRAEECGLPGRARLGQWEPRAASRPA